MQSIASFKLLRLPSFSESRRTFISRIQLCTFVLLSQVVKFFILRCYRGSIRPSSWLLPFSALAAISEKTLHFCYYKCSWLMTNVERGYSFCGLFTSRLSCKWIDMMMHRKLWGTWCDTVCRWQGGQIPVVHNLARGTYLIICHCSYFRPTTIKKYAHE